ncbi:hypothetical protein KY330_00285 [Candidatus Woesearchaeota archaeon]|nr:hypothetical protein [Candidatus Woesearchaeota archaeon]
MEVKKAFKKIVALGVGATMLGATIFGAAALDYKLSDYPKPYVMDDKFDGLLVLGDTAKSEDTIGIADIFGSLQYATKKVVGTGGAEVTIDEGVKLEKAGDSLNWGDYLYSVQETPLDDGQLPSLLKEGTYEDNEGDNKQDTTYTQEIRIFNASSMYLLDADENNNDQQGSYLWLNEDAELYRYRLDFDTAVEYSSSSTYSYADDLESTKIEIMGQVYTITDASFSGATLNKLTLLAGETVMWLTQDVKITRTLAGVEHEIYVVDVSENEDACGVNVDGTTVWVDVDSTETVNGVEIGVTDAKAIHTATQDTDVCEVNVGATELVLQEGQEVEQGGADVDGSEVNFIVDTTGTPELWEGFNITFELDDEVWLKPGENWVDPVFGGFKFDFASEVAVDKGEISFTASGDAAELKFTNADGVEIEIPFKLDDSDNIYMGKDTDEKFFLMEDSTSVDCNTGKTTYDDCEGTFLFVVDSGEVPHVMEITDIDSTNNKTKLRDVNTGKDYEDSFDSMFSSNMSDTGSYINVDLGTIGTITIGLDTSGNIVPYNLQLENAAETENVYILQAVTGSGATLNGVAQTEVNVTFREPDDEDNHYDIMMRLERDTADDELQFSSTHWFTAQGTYATWYTSTALAENDDDDDTKYQATEWGTLVSFDDDDPRQSIVLETVSEQRYGNVFLAPTSAEVSVGAAGETAVPVRIDTGAVIFASELPATAQNLILVGGPCVNSKAAEVMGNPADCTEGFEEGKAMIKLFDNNGKVALLVAGYSGLDTRAAAQYLANYAKHESVFSKASDEISLSVTSLDKVSASIPTE